MQDVSLLFLFTEPLARAGIEYMVTGSVACIVYGEPRMTHDLDLVVELVGPDAAKAIERAFPAADFYVPPVEVIRVEQARPLRGHFNVLHHDTGYKADVYLRGRDALHAWAFPRRRKVPVGTSTLVVAPPEYVVVRKLEYFREGGSEKHLDDIAGVLRVSGAQVDVAVVERLAGERGLLEPWAEAQRRAAT